ncbi:MAG TPA: transcription elongation factor GreA [candidate division CPR3 bacterium]|uniref:Transcription elongation factor GreA n=1 Tax=candidate division CPR3 bacterium TaxID=2268181 RepID=A0A7C1T5R5_UNCC3|nr:transcription elongation factor GreA [candidate division CPR3 bacterium]
MATYITKEGLKKLEEELKELKTTKRQEIAARLRKAISFGDLSENFDYHNAKEEQEMLERKIIEIGEKIHTSEVVGKSTGNGAVQIGSNVELKDGTENITYTIVTALEADPISGKISVESPIGSALLLKKKGDKVKIETPNGSIDYLVVKIS